MALWAMRPTKSSDASLLDTKKRATRARFSVFDFKLNYRSSTDCLATKSQMLG